jgi:hypothetical protein
MRLMLSWPVHVPIPAVRMATIAVDRQPNTVRSLTPLAASPCAVASRRTWQPPTPHPREPSSRASSRQAWPVIAAPLPDLVPDARPAAPFGQRLPHSRLTGPETDEARIDPSDLHLDFAGRHMSLLRCASVSAEQAPILAASGRPLHGIARPRSFGSEGPGCCTQTQLRRTLSITADRRTVTIACCGNEIAA